MTTRAVQPGECVSVCAACGARVVVPPIAGLPPTLAHGTACPRGEWPLGDAVQYEPGEVGEVDAIATIYNWPNGNTPTTTTGRTP